MLCKRDEDSRACELLELLIKLVVTPGEKDWAELDLPRISLTSAIQLPSTAPYIEIRPVAFLPPEDRFCDACVCAQIGYNMETLVR